MVISIIDRTALTMSKLAGMLAESDVVDVMVKVIHPGRALKLLKLYTPDVIIIDMNLSGYDGLELIEQVKEFLPEAGWIGLTSYAVEQYRKSCMQAGVYYCLDKNQEFEKIPEILEEMEKKARFYKT